MWRAELQLYGIILITDMQACTAIGFPQNVYHNQFVYADS